jgi:hypothetical protein
MERQLKEALMKLVNEREAQLGRKLERAELESLLTSLGDQLLKRSPGGATTELKAASCGSFQCPSSYSCDWF